MKIKYSHPLISCICITKNRTAFLLKAIICFDTQTYPNKELIISYPENDIHTEDLIAQISKLTDFTITGLKRNGDITIGASKNEAILKAKGEYICIWDDDDWYHPKRLIHQYNTMKSGVIFHEASLLSRITLFDDLKQKAYFSFSYNWGGTLLCKKDILLHHQFQDENIAEDMNLVKYLCAHHYVKHIEDSSFLYIFLYHGRNTLDYFHFAYYSKKSEVLDKASRSWIRDTLFAKVDLLSS